MRTVTSSIIAKYTTKGLQPLNGKYMWMDFPFKRPTLYNFQLAEGCHVEVSLSTYNQYNVGDQFTTECMEFSDYVLMLGIVALVALVVLGFLLLI